VASDRVSRHSSRQGHRRGQLTVGQSHTRLAHKHVQKHVFVRREPQLAAALNDGLV
jgi:hypothetical protein